MLNSHHTSMLLPKLVSGRSLLYTSSHCITSFCAFFSVQGQLSDAYDVLQAMPPRPGGGGPLEFDRALLLGLIRHAQWAQVRRPARAIDCGRSSVLGG